VPIIDEITEAYAKLKDDPEFWAELRNLEKTFTVRGGTS
jgi:tryptophan synthase beta subunit